jgi:hypothetical protein
MLRVGKTCFVPLIEDKQSNMQLLHLDKMDGLREVPPFGIREPSKHYDDGTPRRSGERHYVRPCTVVTASSLQTT